jgi:hypothetical protein
MASGILGQSNPAASTLTTVYTVPGGVTASFTVNISNNSSGAVAIDLALASTATPTASEYVERGTIIPGGGVFQGGVYVAQATERVVVNCGNASCAVNVYGFEQ